MHRGPLHARGPKKRNQPDSTGRQWATHNPFFCVPHVINAIAQDECPSVQLKSGDRRTHGLAGHLQLLYKVNKDEVEDDQVRTSNLPNPFHVFFPHDLGML